MLKKFPLLHAKMNTLTMYSKIFGIQANITALTILRMITCTQTTTNLSLRG